MDKPLNCVSTAESIRNHDLHPYITAQTGKLKIKIQNFRWEIIFVLRNRVFMTIKWIKAAERLEQWGDIQRMRNKNSLSPMSDEDFMAHLKKIREASPLVMPWDKP